MPTDNEFTKVLGWPGYRVYRHQIDEKAKTLTLWVRRKRGNRKLQVSELRAASPGHPRSLRAGGAGSAVLRVPDDGDHRTLSDSLPGVRGEGGEGIEQLPCKAPYSKRFEDVVGQACESAAARQVARRVGLAESTVRAIDLRYLERWEARRRKPPLRQMGVDEIYRGKKASF